MNTRTYCILLSLLASGCATPTFEPNQTRRHRIWPSAVPTWPPYAANLPRLMAQAVMPCGHWNC